PRAGAVRLYSRELRRRAAELALHRHPWLFRLARLRRRLSALVLPADQLRGDRGKRLSLPDAAVRHAVRLAAARRACRVGRSHRHLSGGARHLSRDPPGGAASAAKNGIRAGANCKSASLRAVDDRSTGGTALITGP